MTSSTKTTQIKYWLFSYLDLFGYQRSKLVPASAVELMINDGAGFAGFASWLDLSPADGDLMAVPDFIDLHYNSFHWFTFNVADIFITLGILTFLTLEFFIKRDK